MSKSTVRPHDPIAFDIISISFFTKDPKVILRKLFRSNQSSSTNNDSAEFHLSLIQKVLLQKDYSNTASQIPFYINNEEISFTNFIINKCKYHIFNIIKSNIIIMSNFAMTTKSSIIKLYLFHITVAFFNFIGSQSNFINTTNYSSCDDSFNTKLFEMYVFSPITKHFSILTRSLFKKKELHLVNIKYKTFYLVDLSSNDVIFSLHSTRNAFKRIKRLQLNETLWNELMYHCNNLKVQYIKKYQNRFDSFEYQDYFVKMEYTSTYPRLTFIIKFLPILKGMALIHIYSQNKLSRNEEGKVAYKEFDILYGNEMNKDIGNIEYRYKEPKKLKEIESFFIEFLLSCNSSFGFFFYPKFELKYLNGAILKLIQNNIDNNNQTPCEKLLYKITNSLNEEYISNAKRGSNNNISNSNDEEYNNEVSIKKSEMITNYQWNCISKNHEGIALYQISKQFILNELVNSITPDLTPDEATILFSMIDNQSVLDNNEQHISQLINSDLSILTKNINNKNIFGGNDALINTYSIDQSLFNMNITSIGHNITKENANKHCKHSKSDFVQREKTSGLVNNTTICKDDVVLNILNKSYSDDESENSLENMGGILINDHKEKQLTNEKKNLKTKIKTKVLDSFYKTKNK